MRPTHLFHAIAFASLAAAFAHGPAAAAPRNLLANPGFEQVAPGSDWMPAAWDSSSAGLETVFFGRDTFMVHSGRYSVNVANTSTMYAMSHNWSQSVLLGPEAWGKTAVFSVWTRSNGLDGRAYILEQAYTDTVSRMAKIWGVEREEALLRLGITAINDPLRDLGWHRVQFEDPQTDWVRREARVIVRPGTNMLYVRCGLLGTGQVLFDDASVTLEPTPRAAAVAPGTNLLLDPGFEDGGLAWEWSVPPFEGARIERDTTVVHSGRVSMRALNMNDGVVTARAGLCQPVRADLLRGKRVRISAWFRGDSVSNAAFVLVGVHTRLGKQQSGTTLQLSGTFDWTKNATEFDVPEDAEQIWAWMMYNAPSSGTMWFDDASLEILGPAPRPASAPGGRRRSR